MASKKKTSCPPHACATIRARRIDAVSGKARTIQDTVAQESLIQLRLLPGNMPPISMLATPSDLAALGVGFAFAEGYLDSIKDLLALGLTETPTPAIELTLTEAPNPNACRRTLIVTSACGACGDDLEAATLLDRLPGVAHTLRTTKALIFSAMDDLQQRQRLFPATGGSHAAGLFQADGTCLAFAEDVGRHNALDKAAGLCLLAGRSTRGSLALLSSRASFELVAKCARAGVEVMAAVSAPSSLAIAAAQRAGITLCGFVREPRLTVYSHPQRIR